VGRLAGASGSLGPAYFPSLAWHVGTAQIHGTPCQRLLLTPKPKRQNFVIPMPLWAVCVPSGRRPSPLQRALCVPAASPHTRVPELREEVGSWGASLRGCRGGRLAQKTNPACRVSCNVSLVRQGVHEGPRPSWGRMGWGMGQGTTPRPVIRPSAAPPHVPFPALGLTGGSRNEAGRCAVTRALLAAPETRGLGAGVVSLTRIAMVSRCGRGMAGARPRSRGCGQI
jgi:hypothetical protein